MINLRKNIKAFQHYYYSAYNVDISSLKKKGEENELLAEL